jgi:hypothetical protein
MTQLFARKLEPDESGGTIVDYTAQDKAATGVLMPMPANTPAPLIPGRQVSNNRSLGVLGGQVFKGQSAVDVLAFNQKD